MNKWKKRILAWTGGILSVLLIAAAVVAWRLWSMFGVFIPAAKSIMKLEDGLYRMEYVGDYGFDEFLAQGGADSDSALAVYLASYLSHGYCKTERNVPEEAFGCSTVCVTDEHGVTYFGRNYDWKDCRALIVHTKPDNGFESVSTCCLDFLGFGGDYRPDGSMADRIMTLAAIYVPLDGMNEKGFAVADLMAGDDEETHQQTDKADLTTTTAIRLLLDHASNVNDAIELLKRYDMNSSIGTAHHLAIADATGRSAVVEYVNGEMIVTETGIVTNHYLGDSAKKGVGSAESHIRYNTLNAWAGDAYEDGVGKRLEAVSQKIDNGEGTIWSIVYCLKEGRADFFFRRNYDRGYWLFLGDIDGLDDFLVAFYGGWND